MVRFDQFSLYLKPRFAPASKLPHFLGNLWQADDIQNEADELLRIRDYLFKELAQRTGQPVEKVIVNL